MILTHYIVIRRDLPLGVLCAQITHAAGESAILEGGHLSSTSSRAVVLGVRDEAELMKARRKLNENGIDYVSICESDPPYNGDLMALGLYPIEADLIEKVMRPFQTLKELIIPPIGTTTTTTTITIEGESK